MHMCGTEREGRGGGAKRERGGGERERDGAVREKGGGGGTDRE